MDVLTNTICRHANCGCRPQSAHTPYCSAYCGNVVRAAESDDPNGELVGACSCGHAECGEGLRGSSKTPEPPERATDDVIRRVTDVPGNDRG